MVQASAKVTIGRTLIGTTKAGINRCLAREVNARRMALARSVTVSVIHCMKHSLTRSQAVARIADHTASQHLRGSSVT